MNTGKIISDLRDGKNWSQSDLAARSGISRVMIGKYERDEAMPSIEAAYKIAQAFEVSLDYLVGESTNPAFDKRTVQRLHEIEELSPAVKEKLFFLSTPFFEIPMRRRPTPLNNIISLRRDEAI